LIIVFTLLFLFSCTDKSLYKQKEGYLWLEKVRGDDAMAWVDHENKLSRNFFEKSRAFKTLKNETLKVLNDVDKIAYPSSMINGMVYNLWKDKKNPKGLLRRMKIADYRNNEGSWETVLDLDQLSQKEKRSWFYRGLTCYQNTSPCLLALSPDGTDAKAFREFDLNEKKFIPEGFHFPASKSGFSYLSKNALIISDAFEKSNQTDSGYPRVVKVHRRGRPLTRAESVFTGQRSDVFSSSYTIRDPKTSLDYHVIKRAVTFYESEHFVLRKNLSLKKINIPRSSEIESIFADSIFLKLNKKWKVGKRTYKKGSLVSFPYAELENPKNIRSIFTPSRKSALEEIYTSQEKIYLKVFSNVIQKFYSLDHKFELSEIELPSTLGSFFLRSISVYDETFFLSFQSLLTPNTLYSYVEGKLKKVKSLKNYFKTSDLVEKRYFAKSKDETLIPYTIVHPKEMKLNGQNPTLVYGYGGFRVSLTPYYSATLGQSWLSKKGVYVLTHIRGGGEYGPSWHEAALKEKRQTAYDDFYAIAEDLIKKKITSPKKLAILGGSNGGLLTAVAFNQRPDLYRAVISAVPLTDMMRFHKLLAGASWMGEYGNPDIKEEKEFLLKISPFHNIPPLKKESPWLFMMTNTSDDRVHPAHARKMAKKAKEYGHHVFYFENTEGGHGGRDNYEQRALASALKYSFLYEALGVQ